MLIARNRETPTMGAQRISSAAGTLVLFWFSSRLVTVAGCCQTILDSA